MMTTSIKWQKHYPLTDKNAFICLVDVMGDDNAVVQAARSSYDGFAQGIKITDKTKEKFPDAKDIDWIQQNRNWYIIGDINGNQEESIRGYANFELVSKVFERQLIEDRHLTRYLMNHSHTTPFEMVELKFMVQVPMDCWRQWIRHRTANVNEYSTRYTEALDFFQVTDPSEWRLQATDNKQGSSGFLTEWPEGSESLQKALTQGGFDSNPGQYLSMREEKCNELSRTVYEERLKFGIAKEQARKDLPLSTYTRAYWKCDLHNIFNFLRLRMDSHAQLEIRQFANCMFEIVKQLCPVACEAFEDYVLHAKKFSRMEMEIIRDMVRFCDDQNMPINYKPKSMTDREWKEFLAKLS
jgi:thymidylate synthase (FAD)